MLNAHDIATYLTEYLNTIGAHDYPEAPWTFKLGAEIMENKGNADILGIVRTHSTNFAPVRGYVEGKYVFVVELLVPAPKTNSHYLTVNEHLPVRAYPAIGDEVVKVLRRACASRMHDLYHGVVFVHVIELRRFPARGVLIHLLRDDEVVEVGRIHLYERRGTRPRFLLEILRLFGYTPEITRIVALHIERKVDERYVVAQRLVFRLIHVGERDFVRRAVRAGRGRARASVYTHRRRKRLLLRKRRSVVIGKRVLLPLYGFRLQNFFLQFSVERARVRNAERIKFRLSREEYLVVRFVVDLAGNALLLHADALG